MSLIGKKPVSIPSGVKVEVAGQTVKVAGPKGNIAFAAPAPITVAVESGSVVVRRPNDERRSKAMHGLTRSLINNMVEGVTKGYSIAMELYGAGYGAKLDGKKLLVNCGFMGRGFGKSAQFVLDVPAGLDIKVEVPAARSNTEPAKFTVSGVDKQMVGQFAAEVRKLRKPEPYLGKGIRYAGEQIKRKAGKVFAGGG